jgi:nucleoside-diphosphate-sugar epimerase
VVAIFLNAMAAGAETKIYGDGQQTRDFVHVEDIVSALLAAVGRGGAFNVGSGVELPILELHQKCSAVTGDLREPSFGPAREGDVMRSVLDVSRIEGKLGWRQKVPLDDGLRNTWDWVRSKEGGRAGETK